MGETTIDLTREDRAVLFALLCVCYWQDLQPLRSAPGELRERVRYDLDTDEQGTKHLTYAATLTADELLRYVRRIEQLPPETLPSATLKRSRQDIIRRISALVQQVEARDRRRLPSHPDQNASVSSPRR